MTPRAGVLMPGHSHIGQAKYIPEIPKGEGGCRGPCMVRQSPLLYSNDDQGGVYQNCKFHDP